MNKSNIYKYIPLKVIFGKIIFSHIFFKISGLWNNSLCLTGLTTEDKKPIALLTN